MKKGIGGGGRGRGGVPDNAGSLLAGGGVEGGVLWVERGNEK